MTRKKRYKSGPVLVTHEMMVSRHGADDGPEERRSFPTTQSYMESIVDASRSHAPQTAIEALMCAPCWAEPEVSMEERLALADAVARCTELLPARTEWVLRARTWEEATLREVAAQLGMSYVNVWRIEREAHDRLQHILTLHPLVRSKLNMSNDWRSAAFEPLLVIATDSKHMLAKDPQRMRDDAVSCLHADYDAGVVHHLSILGQWAFRILAETNSNMELVEKIIELLCLKQSKYGHGNINRFGLWGVVVRASDKVERYVNLSASGDTGTEDESVEDTLMDLVGYAVIANMLSSDTFKLPLLKAEVESAVEVAA